MKIVKQNANEWIGALSSRNVIRMVLSHLLTFIIGFTTHFTLMDDSCIIISQDPISIKTNKCREYGDGWNVVEVFYGKNDHFEKIPPLAQANQDVIVSRLFKNKQQGFFLDLAANDATYLSNTYNLEQNFNWTGLCIEPNPNYWSRLSHRNCQVVAAVVGGSRMDEVQFRLAGSEVGGIVGDGFDNRDATDAVVLYTTTLLEILQRFNAPINIDYLSLDVEGAEDLVMQNFPFNKYHISVMTVERPKERLKKILHDNGYDFIGTISDFGETLWALHSVKDSLDFARVQEFLV